MVGDGWPMPKLKQFERIVKQERLSMEQRRLLHDQITGQRLSFQEVRRLAREIKELYPKKGERRRR
jgi:hypothetical protein